MTRPLPGESIEDFVKRSRAEQDKPEFIDDPALYALLAAAIRALPEQEMAPPPKQGRRLGRNQSSR